MASSALKKTVKNEIIRPFQLSSENPWVAVRYRFDPAEAWLNALEASFVVLPTDREDVRREVLHSFEIEVDLQALEADGVSRDDVELILLTRDPFAKNILKFLEAPVEEGVISVDVPRHRLETTSLASRVDFTLILVAADDLPAGRRIIRRGGRLATHTVSVSAEKRGYSFNFTKISGEEFQERGLPKTTTFHLEIAHPAHLIEPCDDVSAVLTVLIHEDAWSTLQEIQGGDRTGEALGVVLLADVLFAVLLTASDALVGGSGDIDDGSVVRRIVGCLADKTGMAAAELEERLKDRDDVYSLQAMIQAALKMTLAFKRVTLEQGGPA